jgi:hypothetical protein
VMISTRSVGLLIDTVVCLTLAKWETVSGRFGGYLTLRQCTTTPANAGRMTQPYNRSFQGYGSAIGAGSHDNIPMLRDAQRPLSMDRCCYHFATQLDGTEQNELIRRRSYRCVLGPKILIEWHAIELVVREEF